jgi:cytochrome P450 / NADPH-cytochrome P450 reductase
VCFVLKFVHSFLSEAGVRSQRLSLVQNYLVPTANAQFEADRATMMDLTNESKPCVLLHGLTKLTLLVVIRKRKESGDNIDDLLGLMLKAKDPETGLGLSDQSIAYNLVTFLIAGHETTSGLLSFAVHTFSPSL